MKKKIEFIESYIRHDDDPYHGNSYEYNDNHGELVRCKDCKNYAENSKCLLYNFYRGSEWFCASGMEHKRDN